ncbi:hypothetical protein [Parathalassolituus penaei]|uniref:Uncharacterized protein n=1 Tax=Parathalassolituus penaei TaxID=2997323 RepID=A0A9X3EG03_9GAMM|nr:hypothetical protein [Parathalassolituus penaei]MCY0966551.1 hypothetical protein [Parathalassolituus penaei]
MVPDIRVHTPETSTDPTIKPARTEISHHFWRSHQNIANSPHPNKSLADFALLLWCSPILGYFAGIYGDMRIADKANPDAGFWPSQPLKTHEIGNIAKVGTPLVLDISETQRRVSTTI